MSMDGNYDYEYATSAAGAANANAAQEFNDAVRADALIHASLAIAHEQRTANLLALEALALTDGARVSILVIKNRLGMAT